MTTTGDGFLTALKRRVTVPANQVLVNNQGMLALADAVIRKKMIPLMMGVNQNYFVTKVVVPFEADEDTYSIPYRSIGRTLRELKCRQQGSENGTYNMALIALEDSHMFQNTSSFPSGFYFQGDKFVVIPKPITTDYEMLQWYDLQPNRIVQNSAASYVLSVSDNVVTCATVPDTMTAGVLVDFVEGKQGCSTLGMDVEITNVAGTQITFASADDIPTALAAGDYIALAQESPVIQLPDEAIPLLETLTGERLLYALGDFDGAALLKADGKEEAENLLRILEPRIEGEPVKIVNRRGLLRGRGFGYWRYGGGYYP